ncbi:GcrA family cell cycle regulator [Bradyrhizobium sp. RDM4]|uniref:GcrA family cell cycle regulator n=1 Tax=Bradyrhizobium sp. RDM4 TaxID=3378765 RepID=UPI0038FC55E0
MRWDERDITLLKELWALGHSAAQIARALGCSRNAVCGRLSRLRLKRGHRPPAAKPRIRPVPKRRLALSAACASPVEKKVSKPLDRQQPNELSKPQLYAMLAEAVKNTG